MPADRGATNTGSSRHTACFACDTQNRRIERRINGQSTRYVYDGAQAIGPDGGNPIQYTARENDGTGLYFYRTRYYDPAIKRFTSQDPIGLAGGD